jgi:hypothetical protein
MNPTPQTPLKNRPPAWLNGAIVLVVLLLGLYAVYYFIFKSDEPKPKTIEAHANTTGANPGRTGRGTTRPNNTGRTQNPPPLINIISGNTTSAANNPINYTYDDQKGVGKIKIRHENTVVTAEYEGPARGGSRGNASGGAPNRNSGIVNLNFDYSTDIMMSWVSVDELNLHNLAWRATNAPTVAEAAGITNDQRRQLDSLSYRPRLSNDEDSQLKKLLLAWVINSDTAAANEVLNSIKTISKAHLDDTKASFKTRIENITKILTPDQIAKLKNN